MYHISKASFYEWKKKVEAGTVFVEHGNNRIDRIATKELTTVAWLKKYIEEMGDRMPDRDCIMLPPGDKKEIYKEYLAEGVRDSVMRVLSLYIVVMGSE